MDKALVRGVPASFDRAIVRDRGRAPLVDLARSQHAAYREALQAAGYEVTTLDPDEDHPDCVFVEDTAVVVGDVAVITRPGAPSRRGETEPVAHALGADLDLVRITPPGRLDGGDVMQLGGTVYAGRSARTDEEGIAQLGATVASLGLTLRVVPVHGVLHLKSGVLPVTDDTVVVTPGTVDERLLDGQHIIHEHETERNRFSALPLLSGIVMVTDAAPRTAEAVSATGVEVAPVDISEFLAADGGLTCLSILYRV